MQWRGEWRGQPDGRPEGGAQLPLLLVRLPRPLALRDHPAHAVPPCAREALPLLRLHVRLQLEVGRAEAHQEAAPQQPERQDHRDQRPGPLSRPQGHELLRERQARHNFDFNFNPDAPRIRQEAPRTQSNPAQLNLNLIRLQQQLQLLTQVQTFCQTLRHVPAAAAAAAAATSRQQKSTQRTDETAT